VIGITTMLLMLGIGSAFSGAAFYAYYDNRLAENEQAVSRFVEGFDQQFTDATSAIDDLRVDTVSEIRDELKPLGDYVADADGVINLPTTAGPSVWLLETRDEDGEIMSGSAFAVVEHRDGTALVTSYALIVASITEPSPGIDLIKGNERIPAQLWAWDQERDVALLVVEEKVPTLEFAGDRSQLASVGARLFALSGVGGNGATASPGVLLDHSQIGLQHTAPVGTLFRGGPLLNGDGKVLGVASDHYRPFGIDPGDVRQAPDVRAICVLILECSEVREEITVEVAAEETDAPLTDAEPVRDTPTGEEIIPADDEETDQTRDGADDDG
jgi:S1-C subfamily serine protease